ncbi:hypothetical protein CWE08_05340 [Aliidiomarina iranensis]|uniref:Peptidase S8 n=1 Tax=Aliidiomarina iranensis TaxID=1434071 RepID=A0A432W0Q4_9GAMM|nr:S8 family serine peptidase [Aliidiomarina iranensis]RUO22599.1 hypothetical protein CWE08_05340 [Aliidiomarina iranensis]
MKESNHLPRLTVVASMVAAALTLGASANTAPPQEASTLNVESEQRYRVEKNRAVQVALPNYYIVQLEDPAAVQYEGGVSNLQGTSRTATKRDRFDANSTETKSYQQYLLSRQSEFAQALRSRVPGADIETNYTLLMNGVAVAHQGDESILEQLRALPGVINVWEDEVYHLNMDASNSIINAPEVWEMLGGQDDAGAGVRVAILDSGILNDHPMFQANGHTRPEGLPGDDYCATVDANFCNDKIVSARVYEPRIEISETEITDSPYDVNGHGSHVAGTAVGNLVSTTFNNAELSFSGVAPGASLYVYKSFYLTPEGNGSANTVSILEALEDILRDDVDVINNSWGGGAGEPTASPYFTVWQNVEAAGIINVTSAGNSGPGPVTVGCPGCIEEGLTVASTETGRTFANTIEGPGLDGAVALPGSETNITEAIAGPLMPAMEIDAENALACAPFPEGSFAGHIAVVSRGDCAFGDKATNFENAGAIAMILYNNAAGTISMNMPDTTLPSVSITQADGNALLEAWVEGDTATINPTQAVINPERVDVMSSFSSRGPNFDASYMKPDIAAPGTAILSAYPVNGEWSYSTLSGTSMAGPHVAGAAALLTQMRPELSQVQVKSMLMTSSNPNVLKEDAVTVADGFDMGAGRLDVAAAFNTAVTFDRPSFSAPRCFGECTFTRTATSVVGEDTEWTASVTFQDSSVVGSLSFDTLALEGGAEAEFTLNVDTRFAPTGWQHGRITFTDTSGMYADMVMPIAVQATRSDDEQVLSSGGDTSEVTSTDGATLSTRVNDLDFEGPVSIAINQPEGLTVDSESVVVDAYRAEGEISVTEGGDMLWVGNFDSIRAEASLVEAATFPGAGLNLRDAGAGVTLGCLATSCDETRVGLTLGAVETGYGFIFNGVGYTSLGISDNGFVSAGTQNHAGAFANQNLPDTEAPNNILAPFWTDLDAGGAAGGDIRFGAFDFGEPGRWVVVEWNDVVEWKPEYTGDEERYSFSIWIQAGVENNMFIQYFDTGATLPANLTVGFENVAGDLGTSYYYNGEGTAPMVGTLLTPSVVAADNGSVEINYTAGVETFGTAESADADVMQEGSVEISLTDFTEQLGGLVNVTVTNGENSLEAINPLILMGDGNYTVEVVTEPANGTVTTEDGSVIATYAPETGFWGSDSFEFRIVDGNGAVTNTATVSVEVEKLNEAPVAVAQGPSLAVSAGETVTLNGSRSTDVDGDTLTYRWTQTSGPAVSLSNASSATATFTVPEFDNDATLGFRLSVSDGEFTDTALVNVEVNKHSDKKWFEGNFGALLLLLGLPLVWIRRRKQV